MKVSTDWLDASGAAFSAGTGEAGYAHLKHYTAAYCEWGEGPPLVLVPGNCPFRPPWVADCLWRDAPMRALERAGRRYKIVSTAGTVWSLHDAVTAGLGVTAMPANGLPQGLHPVRPDEGLPELPEVSLLLIKAPEPRQPLTDILAAQIVDVMGANSHSS